jgi:hypothetical protein
MKSKKFIKPIFIFCISAALIAVTVLSVLRYTDLNRKYPSMADLRIPPGRSMIVSDDFAASFGNFRIFSEDELAEHFNISEASREMMRSPYPTKYILVDMEFVNYSGATDIYDADFVLRYRNLNRHGRVNTWMNQLLFGKETAMHLAGIGETITTTMMYTMEYDPGEEDKLWSNIKNSDFEIVYRSYPYLYIWEL